MDRNTEWAIKTFENALACCEESGEQDENLLVTLNNLGALYASTAMNAAEDDDAAKKAASMYERALELSPNDLSTLYGLGVLRRDMGHTDAARESFESAAAIAPHDRQISYQLALLDRAEGKEVHMEAAPREYVASLFDYYASNDYDEHLLSLEYKGPELLWTAFKLSEKYQGLDDKGKLQDLKVLEIGCGSGLVGKYFRSRGLGYSFEGCDLSPVMTKTATDAIFSLPDDPSNIDMVYSKVECTDASTFLQDRGDGAADLVLGGDVLCYVGRLDDIIKSAATSLSPGGIFCFTVEKMTNSELELLPDGIERENQGFTLRSSGRFAHSEEYIAVAVKAAGLRVEMCQEATLRMDNKAPVQGLVYTLTR